MNYQFNTLTRDAGGTLVRKWRHLRSLPESHMTHSEACEVELLFAIIGFEEVDPIPDVFNAIIYPKHLRAQGEREEASEEDQAIWAKVFKDLVKSYNDFFQAHRSTIGI